MRSFLCLRFLHFALVPPVARSDVVGFCVRRVLRTKRDCRFNKREWQDATRVKILFVEDLRLLKGKERGSESEEERKRGRRVMNLWSGVEGMKGK